MDRQQACGTLFNCLLYSLFQLHHRRIQEWIWGTGRGAERGIGVGSYFRGIFGAILFLYAKNSKNTPGLHELPYGV